MSGFIALLVPSISSAIEPFAVGLRASKEWGRGFGHCAAYTRFDVSELRGGDRWRLGSYVETGVGCLSGRGQGGPSAALGPGALLARNGIPIQVDVGISSTILGRTHYGRRSLGGPLQFVSHVGLRLDVTSAWALCFRCQHMSNADLYKPNPGVNMSALEINYRLPWRAAKTAASGPNSYGSPCDLPPNSCPSPYVAVLEEPRQPGTALSDRAGSADPAPDTARRSGTPGPTSVFPVSACPFPPAASR